ncbi:MAG: glycosyltransferase family 1 protein [Nitrospiraceae bacterium]|nr:MAG: glycosyltransferase family 1 protein [Nitrospiraceae bacterium]
MKFLIINTDYPDFLYWLYALHPGLEDRSYKEQFDTRAESLFGVADFYSANLIQLGHEAREIHANNEWIQRAWAREHGIIVHGPATAVRKGSGLLRRVPTVASSAPVRWLKSCARPLLRPRMKQDASWFYDILSAQIKHDKPDIILNQDMGGVSVAFLAEMKPHYRFLVGQHAATPLTMDSSFQCYDLMISSFPPTVEMFRRQGFSTALNRLGFDPRILARLLPTQQKFDVALVGSFSDVHSSRVVFLNTLYAKLDQPEIIKVWAPTVDHLPVESPIRRQYMGPAWGHQMYEILNASKMTLNHHGDVLPYANNMRLFESTGTGTLLITDWKDNLHEMFEPEKEVVTYRSPEECAEKIRHYLTHEAERQIIASAGQARTLRDHTYQHRLQEFADLVCRNI